MSSSLYESLMEKLNGHRYDGYFSSCCPFHPDSHPSFFVYQNGNWRCSSCRAWGKTLDQLAKRLGNKVVTSPTARVVLPRWREWEIRYGDMLSIAQHAHDACKRFTPWMWYFEERKIEQFFEQGMFGYLDGWVLFPVFDDKRKIQNIVVRMTKGNGARYVIKQLEERKPLLYCPNWERFAQSDTVYVPFGLIDAWAFEAIGLACVTGITGKSLDADLLKQYKKRYVFVPDEWEELEAHKLANKIGYGARVKQLSYPEDTKDPDGVRRLFGNETLLSMIGA